MAKSTGFNQFRLNCRALVRLLLSLKLKTRSGGGRRLHLTGSAFPVCGKPGKRGQLLGVEKWESKGEGSICERNSRN